jgi:hypothetical protein
MTTKYQQQQQPMMNKTNNGKGVTNAHGPLTMACSSHQ